MICGNRSWIDDCRRGVEDELS